MAKVNTSTAKPGSNSQTIAPNAIEDLSKEMIQQEPMDASPVDQDLLDAMSEVEAAPAASTQSLDMPEAPAMGGQPDPVMESEMERTTRPGMKQRMQLGDDGKWKPKQPKITKNDDGFGGIFSRANRFAANVTNENIGMSSFLGSKTTDGLPVVLRKSGAVQDGLGKAQYNADFLAAMSIVTENWMADNFGAEQRRMEAEAKRNDIGNDPMAEVEETPQADTRIKKLQGNEQLGTEIVREYQRIQGDRETTDVLSPDEARLLGDAAKEMFAVANPEMVARDSSGKQTEFVLTPEGADIMANTDRVRKRLFPKQQIRPAKVVHASGKLPGEAKNFTKEMSGELKPQADSAMIAEAKRNAASIANVVDSQREKILYMTMLPVLGGTPIDNPVMAMNATINNVGPNKMQELIAKEKAKHAEGDLDFSAQSVMNNIHNKAAEEVRSVAMERGGANYFTYYTMAYNGRIAPQQTAFDATNAKNVRFVTRAADPSVARKGNRIDKNLRQMYSMMLVGKNTSGITLNGNKQAADMLLPEQRERALVNATPQLVAWGRRLRHLVETGMTDSQLEAVAAAIAAGEKLTINDEQGNPIPNPNFPQFTGLQLDPEADAELINEIKGKGEDGMHFIDGLIDFAKYDAAMKSKGQYASFFNAYFDGKTNGLAANGIQMGSMAIALRTGVVRTNDKHLLDDGDLRDELAKVLTDTLISQTGGLQNTPDGLSQEYYTIAHAVFNHRDLNKWSTMTFGYGLDISSMAGAIEESANILYEQKLANPEAEGNQEYISAYETVRSQLNEPEFGNILLPTYSAGVVSVLSPEAIKSRALMKMSAAIAAFNNKTFTIMGPHGMPLHFGGKTFDEDAQPTERQSYVIKDGGKTTKRTADSYPGATKTAAAHRDGTPGGKAMGGSVPGPIQATDAATVASLLSGKSWEKMKSASNGKPYVHSIYDAFKVDARSYDVALEEVNNNWYNINMKWSYLKEAKKSVDKNMNGIIKSMQKLDDKSTYATSEFPMLRDLLVYKETEYGFQPHALTQFLKTTMDLPADLTPAESRKVAQDQAKMVVAELDKKGIALIDEPLQQLTGAQIKHAMRVILKSTQIQKRLTAMIEKNEVAKKKLDAEIKRLGVPNLQYYAH